jgi:hemerythrin
MQIDTSHPIAFKRTGIPTIDDQHGQLVSYLERLLNWIERGYGFAATLDALQFLFDYTRTHFEFEEQLMREHGYPRLAEHIEKHRAIEQGLGRVRSDLESGKDVEVDLTATLRKWIVEHIDVEDFEYALFMGTATR